MYYTPVLPDGKVVPLPWQIKTFYYNIGWPLKDNPTFMMKLLNYTMVSVGCFIFVFIDEAELHFIVEHFSDISLSVEAIVTCCILNELLLRIFHMALYQNSFKKFLKDFFRYIYVDEDKHPQVWKKIRRDLIPCTVYTYGYISTLASFLITPFLTLRKNEKLLPYKMTLPYSYDDPIVYGITLGSLCWLGYSIIFFIIGEAFLLASCILHLNTRYEMLHEEMQHFSIALVSSVSRPRIASAFRRDLIRMFVRVCDLNRFAIDLNDTYKFRIFVMFALSAGFLCVLCFQVASLGASMENVKYASWIVAKISELLIFGTLGSALIHTTDKTSSMYYMSNWEEIIYRSTNRKENVLLMKDLQIIMSLHRNPIRLSGFNYFDVSLDTVIKVLRGAFSYFTCLYTVKDN